MENDLIEILEGFINSPEGKKYSKKLAHEFEQQRLEREEKISRVKTPEFIKWLKDFIEQEDFVIEGPSFPSDLNTEEDFRNVKCISYLYTLIDDYARDNYYYPNRSDNGFYYNIKIDDLVYSVGGNFSQGSMFYVSLGQDDDYAFSYEDVIKNNPNPNKTYIESKMYHLSSTINELLDEFPYDMVDDVVKNTFKEYKKGKVKKKTMN